ncbi:MAG: YihY/virulence factor BrkB family protein [Dermatophilaceae bacterium]
MAAEGQAVVKDETAPEPDDPRKPQAATEIKKPGWKYTLKAAWHEFGRDQCTDLAAALTYYSVLAVFPALLALVSLLGVVGQGQSTVDALLKLLDEAGVGNVDAELRKVLTSMVNAGGAGFALVTGILGALWSASGYVGAFGRAMNRIYQIDEGRPFWKLRPIQLAVTVFMVILAALVLLGLVVSGPLTQSIGDAIGLGDTAVTVWTIAKWPVILAIVVVMVAVLYYTTPNVRQPKIQWVSIGAVIAILTWVLASLAFGFYVSQFSNYNKTYGSLAGVVVFLLWLWLTNLALLFGAEVDSELERARQLQAGIVAERNLQLPPRDDTKSKKAAAKLEKKVAEGRELRESSGNSIEPIDPHRTGERAQAKPDKEAARQAAAAEPSGLDSAARPPIADRPATPEEQPVTTVGFVGMIGLVVMRVLARRKKAMARAR